MLPSEHCDIPFDKQLALLQTLQAQHQKIMQRKSTLPFTMVPAAASYFFTNSLFASAKAYSSTPVLLRVKGNTVKTLVQIKRNEFGDVMPSVNITGPVYKLSGLMDDELVTRHACKSLLRVYARVMLSMKATIFSIPAIDVPTLPPSIHFTFDEEAAVKAAVSSLTSDPALRSRKRHRVDDELTATTSDELAATTSDELTATTSDDESSRCYICWEKVPCDVLFPCMIPSHACCRGCVSQLYERWSSTEFEGCGTVKCPQCSSSSGVLRHVNGEPLIFRSLRYPIRKQRKQNYRRVKILR